MGKMTKAQRGLAALVAAGCTIRAIHRKEAARYGLLWAYEAALKGGLLISAGYETTVAAEDWLQSAAGRAALEATNAKGESIDQD